MSKEIGDKKKKLEAEIEQINTSAREKTYALRKEIRQLKEICKHPNLKVSYGEYVNEYCQDCGYDENY